MTLLIITGVITADQIRPNQETSVIKKEDETVTLSCSYDTSSSNVRLYWYRQYPNGELHYLIYKYSGGGGGSPSDPRFQSATPQSSTELNITGVTLSDSALYYCALRVLYKNSNSFFPLMSTIIRPTIYNSHNLIILVETPVMWLLKRDTFAQSITTLKNTETFDGKNIYLICKYDGTMINVCWHRQYLGSRAPVFNLTTRRLNVTYFPLYFTY
uniref:Ig-like domain-containing protein n=1 Tax=Cyprinus carpio TaxID=7962 RepID=A0A8C2I660_CYPCA